VTISIPTTYFHFSGVHDVLARKSVHDVVALNSDSIDAVGDPDDGISGDLPPSYPIWTNGGNSIIRMAQRGGTGRR
jgi:hypothetical protein